MKTEQVQVGQIYAAKVTDKVVPIRIDKENPRGGWDATNLHTNRQVCIKSARKLRNRITGPTDDDNAKEPKRLAKKKLNAKERAANHGVKMQVDAKTVKNATSTPMRNTGERIATSGNTDAKKGKRLSGLDAAAQVLTKTGEPMNCKDLVERMLTNGLWQTSGKTPANTLYAAILREIKTKGTDARFIKAQRGKFALTPAPGNKNGA